MQRPEYHPRQGQPSPESPVRQDREVRTLAGNDYTVPLAGAVSLAVHSPLGGEHQRRNLALAIAASIALRPENLRADALPQHGFDISDRALAEGIANTRWPGRLETIAPNLLLDVAHNPAGAWTLLQARQITPVGGLIVATGSVYLVGEVREMAMTEGHAS